MMNGEAVVLLLVEDDPDHAELIIRGLVDNLVANRIHPVLDGEAALDYLFRRGEYTDPRKSPTPHLILLDLRLPKVDGYQVCQTLKGNPITSRIPIIMITALTATPQKIKGIEHGADDYVSKPFDLDELSARVKMIMRRLGASD